MNETILAVVLRDGIWTYYFAEIDLWVMDWKKWQDGFTAAGYTVPSDSPGPRFGVQVLDDDSAAGVLSSLKDSVVTTVRLREELRELSPVSSWWDVSPLFPSVFLDFDERRLMSVYSETLALENYVPTGWVGIREDFYHLIPMEHRYWLDDERDYFRDATGRNVPKSPDEC